MQYEAESPGELLFGSGQTPRLSAIYIAEAAGGPMRTVERVRVVSGSGLEGDRYAARRGTFSRRSPVVAGSRPVSLIAAEAVAECGRRLQREFDASAFRRNLLTSGLDLAACIGRRLHIGEAVLEVLCTCPPCGRLSRLAGADLRTGLKGIGGVRAGVVSGGELVAGEPIVVVAP